MTALMVDGPQQDASTECVCADLVSAPPHPRPTAGTAAGPQSLATADTCHTSATARKMDQSPETHADLGA